METLRQLPASTYVRALPIALVAAVVIGVPADLINTRFFARPIAVKPIDYVILAITAALMGLIFAIRPDVDQETNEAQQNRAVLGGFVSFLAVGCPVCNQLVVGLVGASGALSWWAPVQPIIGLVAVMVLLFALRQRLATYRLTSCPIEPALR